MGGPKEQWFHPSHCRARQRYTPFLLNSFLFLPRPENQPLPWLYCSSAYCVLIDSLTDVTPILSLVHSSLTLTTWAPSLCGCSLWLWLWSWSRLWLSLWQKRLMDTPQSSKSQAWQEVASIHSSAILQALLAPSE